MLLSVLNNSEMKRADFGIVTELPTLDIHRLFKAGAVCSGMVTQWEWATFILAITAKPDHLQLSFGDQTAVAKLSYMPGAAGGEFPLWHCPRCDRRVWRLHLRENKLG